MNKANKKTWIITTIICLIPMFVSILMYDKLPEQIPTHFDFNGQVDGYSSRFFAAIILPGIMASVNVLLPLIIKADPKNQNISPKTVSLIMWIMPIITLFASGVSLSSALGIPTDVNLISKVLMPFVFIVVGNALPKMAQSYTVGIKLPWTLADEENWNATHRLAGYLWVGVGLFMLALAFVPGITLFYFFPAIIGVLVPIIYSYLLYIRKSKK